MTRFDIFKRHNGRYYYRVIAETGHNILSSDGYENKTGCQEAIRSVKNKISKKEELLIEKADSETWKFIVKGDHNWPVGYSMNFHSEKQCRN
ncbi:MAG: DUF1508 domain-containing protein [Chitinophagaceae bacterium]|nr:DUF1508 domain-containing protein [Chitinophagaceae bacterium]